MAIKKHPGINQTTGRLKKGWKWGSNGNPVEAGGSASTGGKRKRRTGAAAPKTVGGKLKAAVRKVGRKLGTQK